MGTKRSILVLIFLNGLVSCSYENTQNAKNNKILNIDICAEIPTVDPALSEDWNTYRIVNDLYAGLVDFNQANQPTPGMAESWDISQNHLTYTFHLRDNLKFSNGSSIKASDFVFSWRRLVAPKTGSSYAFLLKDVLGANDIINNNASPDTLGVFAPNDKTFIVKLSHPTSAFLNYITTPNVFVVSEAAVTKYGNDWTKPQNIVTSGAYVLKAHVVNGYILVGKNTQYYEESEVHISYVKYFPFIDTNASLSSYKTKSLDMTCQTVPVDQYKLLHKEYKDELHTFPWERLEFLNFNMKLSKYANNLKLRQALAMAIDRSTITNIVLGAGQHLYIA